MKRYFNFLVLFVVSSSAALAQTKQMGNVVEYFGKEKIETTSEGLVVHRFDQGLVLPKATAGGTLFNGQDIIAWLYTNDKFRTPKAGDTLAATYPSASNCPVWVAAKADSTHTFRGRDMRSAYLYNAYNSPREKVVLVETTGGTRTYINGVPYEGDHYDFGYALAPVKLRKGLNEFIYTPGRFGRVTTKIVEPTKAVQFTTRDMTLADVILGEMTDKWAAIRVVNATSKELKGLKIRATLADGTTITSPTDQIMPMAVRKLKFRIPAASVLEAGRSELSVDLIDSKGKVVDSKVVPIEVRSAAEHHERTFVSKIDGSVQYYSVAPAIGGTKDKALVLSVHGASVEARNQARAYKKKDDFTIAAATNRRPFGFNWEEWGRIDALEVLAEAKRVFQTDPARSYLTGHSMGGHGTWFLGTTYPDKFAAIAPCASYPDIITYGAGRGDKEHRAHIKFEPIARAANAGRVRALIENLKQSGVYVLHGDADKTVPVEQVREMRTILSTFHPNFCYYEYPNGEHWYGDHSVDWKPIFEFFARQTIPTNKEVRSLDFHTATPVVSASDYWVKVEQQIAPYDFSRVQASIVGDTIKIEPSNIALLTLDVASLEMKNPLLTIGEQTLQLAADCAAHIALADGKWSVQAAIDSTAKYAERQGGFKQAFDNNVVLVYATSGTKAENEWWAAKARFDAESFYYKGNGSMDVVADRNFKPALYADRNVVIYGNADNNSAWASMLGESPIQVRKGSVEFGDQRMVGDNFGAYFVAPRPDSQTAMVGAVAGSGLRGARATWANNYISGITGFPEYMIFTSEMLRDGLSSLIHAGFYNNTWGL